MISWLRAHPVEFIDALGQHCMLSGTGLVLGVALALPLALLLVGRPRGAAWATTSANLLRTLPSLAVLAALLPLLGVGFTPSVFALALLAAPPVLLHSLVGLALADPAAREAARAMGMTGAQILARVTLPLALPQVFAGLRTASVQVIGGAALASFIGGGGLGDLVTQGMALVDTAQMMTGAVSIALLALAAEAGFAALQRRSTR